MRGRGRDGGLDRGRGHDGGGRGHRGRGRGHRGRGRGNRRNHFKMKAPLNIAQIDSMLYFLKQHRNHPQVALDIAKGCGLEDASDVNPTLYRLCKSGIVHYDKGPPLCWTFQRDYTQNDISLLTPRLPPQVVRGVDGRRPVGARDMSFLGGGRGGGGRGAGLEGEEALLGSPGPGRAEGPGGPDDGPGGQLEDSPGTPRDPLEEGIEEDVDMEAAFEEDYDYEEEEEESFEISDRINDLMASRSGCSVDISEMTHDSESMSLPGSCENSSDVPSTDDDANAEQTSRHPESADPLTAVGVAAEQDPVVESDLSFTDVVLKTLAARLMKTGAAFVLVRTMNSTIDEVEEALRTLEVEKLVSVNGSAWQVTRTGDEYLQRKGLCGPDLDLKPNIKRGDRNIYHPARRGATHGVPLNPLELLGSQTKFGVTGEGRDEDLARIAADVKGVTDPTGRRKTVSLMNMPLDSVVTKHGLKQVDAWSQPGGHPADLAAMPRARPSGAAGAYFQGQGQTLQNVQSRVLSQSQSVTSSSGLVSNVRQAISLKEHMSGLNSTRQSAPQAQGQTTHKPLPLTPLDLINQERSGQKPNVSSMTSRADNSFDAPQSMRPSASNMLGPGESGYRSLTGSPALPGLGPGPQFLPVGGLANQTTMGLSLGHLPHGGLEITTETFSGVNKNPVSALMEFAQSRQSTATIEVISQRGPSHKPKFVMAAFIGSRQFPSIECSSKKDGKKEAADVAMRILLAEGHRSSASPASAEKTLVSSAAMTHFDKVAALTHQAFNQLIACIPEAIAGRKIIAGLVLKRGPDDLGIVVSIGSGNRCITGQQLSLEGTTVNDCHAEIITRRGFLRFLYNQLETYSPDEPHDLFEPAQTGRLQMKPGISFHLYISTAPCGDGALFSPRDAEANKGSATSDRQHHPTFTSPVQGLLRTKMEGGEGTIPIEADFEAQTFDGIQRGERLRTMSCTDKICRWNVLGLQGALLSHFLEPIYLDSLTLGLLFDQGHLSRAVCCRVNKSDPPIDSQLPAGYHLNHPWLGRVTACDPPRETQKTKSLSINWCLGDARPEVLDGPLGLCHTGIEQKFFSRLAKKNLYDNFKTLASKFNRSDLLTESYIQAKLLSKDFQMAKAAMLKRFRDNKFGPWVSKPIEEDMFS